MSHKNNPDKIRERYIYKHNIHSLYPLENNKKWLRIASTSRSSTRKYLKISIPQRIPSKSKATLYIRPHTVSYITVHIYIYLYFGLCMYFSLINKYLKRPQPYPHFNFNARNRFVRPHVFLIFIKYIRYKNLLPTHISPYFSIERKKEIFKSIFQKMEKKYLLIFNWLTQ